MTIAQETLRRNPPVSDNTHQGWHEKGYHTLHGKEGTDMTTQTYLAKIDAHTSQIGSPHRKL